jgi:hypothetical protein
MELIALIKSAERLRQAVTTGEIAEIISDAELEAARQALLKVNVAVEPKQQIWSAINHLEAAHERLKRIYSSKWGILTSKRLQMLRMLEKDRFVLCLMASCYFVLDEMTLCRKALDEAEEADVGGADAGGHPLELLDPRLWREFGIGLFGNRTCSYELNQVREVRDSLLGENNSRAYYEL